MLQKYFIYLLISAISFSVLANAAEDVGKTAFENNCQACHNLKKFTVGPSLVEIRKSYPEAQEKEFIAWAMNPGRKRPEGIQMPSMAHVGEENLVKIHQHILAISKGVKIKKGRNDFTFKPPAKTYPYVQRGLMPYSSPAAIGVVFSPALGINWDASIARLRYAFVGHKPFFSGERQADKLKADVLFQETAENFWSFAQGQQVDFKGYRLINDLPEFFYQIADIVITEKISALANENAFIRQFKLMGVKTEVELDLSYLGNATVTASAGHWVNNKLTLTAQQAASFSIKVSIH
ncbi:MAG: c-type cytochrome [Thalassotalea sp.]